MDNSFRESVLKAGALMGLVTAGMLYADNRESGLDPELLASLSVSWFLWVMFLAITFLPKPRS